MAPSQRPRLSFIEELKRRKVPRVTVVYLAVAYAVVEAVDLLAPRLELPDATVDWAIGLGAAGLPVAIALTWFFDLTAGGIRRTPDAPERSPAGGYGWLSPGSLAAMGVAVAAGALGGWLAGASGPGDGDGSVGDRASIAVLPFVDMSASGDQGYLGEGVAEELLNVLAQIPGLRVAARTSSFAFGSREVDIRTVGDSLGVTTVLEGSVRRSGDQVRITAQLIDAETNAHLWSGQFDRDAENLIAVQEEIAGAIARELRLPLRIGLEHAGRRTADPAAYDAFLRGRAHLAERDVRRASSEFGRAVARDPAFALAHAGLAEARALMPYYGLAPWEESLPAAEEAARRALALDSDLVSARTALANVLRDRWAWSEAEREYEAALRLAPDDPEALDQYAQLLIHLRRFEEATTLAERAAELDPLAWVHRATAGWAHFLAGRHEEAEAALLRVRAMEPGAPLYRTGLFFIHLADGREAELEGDRAWVVEPRHASWNDPSAHAAATEELLARLRRTEHSEKSGLLEALGLVAPRDVFLEELESWAEAGHGPIQILWIPELQERFGDDPRFREVVRATGVDGAATGRDAPG